jgi:hypothetical protein
MAVELQETARDAAANVAGVLREEDFEALKQGDVEIICPLLKTRTKRDAAATMAGVSEVTVYRRLADAAFRRVYCRAKQLYWQEAVWDCRLRLRRSEPPAPGRELAAVPA